mmetsp:Transcript_19718/g.17428  ORF Transcript_19718/g.17428 Transcript_19718/m.17428 type:complete len:245 (-) Transcript_19718:919-1653(-)
MKKVAAKIASQSELPEAKVIFEMLKIENDFSGAEFDQFSDSADLVRLHNTALQFLSSISRRQAEENFDTDMIYKKDVFKEAILILLTKQVTSSHSLLNTNLSDYLWFNLSKCHFEDSLTEFRSDSSSTLTLKHLQAGILSFGESYFNENGENPLNFYKVLILVGLFNEAVQYLDTIDSHRIQNTHIALCLSELDLLNKTVESNDMDVDTLHKNSKSKTKKKELGLFAKILKNFIDFLGKDYFPQ